MPSGSLSLLRLYALRRSCHLPQRPRRMPGMVPCIMAMACPSSRDRASPVISLRRWMQSSACLDVPMIKLLWRTTAWLALLPVPAGLSVRPGKAFPHMEISIAETDPAGNHGDTPRQDQSRCTACVCSYGRTFWPSVLAERQQGSRFEHVIIERRDAQLQVNHMISFKFCFMI